MTDKVLKIREKVVEMVNSINPFIPDEDGKNSDYEAGKLDAATKILQIIDSLEEPMSEGLDEAASKYCEGSSFEDAVMERPAYIAGYHQAEKNLELTWYDVKMLQDISATVFSEVARGSVDYYQIYPTEQSFLEEVLKRFKEMKGNTNGK